MGKPVLSIAKKELLFLFFFFLIFLKNFKLLSTRVLRALVLFLGIPKSISGT
jgi:hypothetical protein